MVFSASCCQLHQPWLSPFLSDSSCQIMLEIIKMTMSPPLEIGPQRVSLHSSPICSSFQTMSCHNYSQSCLIWPVSMHLTGRNCPSESQKCVQLYRAAGGMLRDLSDRLNHVMWKFSKEAAWQSWAQQSDLAQLPTSCKSLDSLFKFPMPQFPHL